MGNLLGQRPVIIMRGQEPVVDADNVYLVVFRDIVLRGGGIQYQQLTDVNIAQTVCPHEYFWDLGCVATPM